jgi:hypothetical protein
MQPGDLDQIIIIKTGTVVADDGGGKALVFADRDDVPQVWAKVESVKHGTVTFADGPRPAERIKVTTRLAVAPDYEDLLVWAGREYVLVDRPFVDVRSAYVTFYCDVRK